MTIRPSRTAPDQSPDGVSAPERQRDPERTRNDILQVARREFAEKGYAGARVDEIAAQTSTTKRMIYFYFGGKEQLYLAVLQQVYAEMRQAEQKLNLERLDPLAAIRRLAEMTFDHQEAHPEFSRLVSVENIDRAEHLAKLPVLASVSTPIIDLISNILDAGRRQGVFTRDDVDAVDVHMLISAYCNFRLANRHTFRAIFGRDLTDKRRRAHYREMLGDMVTAYLTSPPDQLISVQPPASITSVRRRRRP